MRRTALLGWIPPLIITVGIVVYVGGAATGRWDPTGLRSTEAPVVANPDSTDPVQRRASAELCPLINRPDILRIVEQPATVKAVGTSYGREDGWLECIVTLPHSSLRLNVAREGDSVADYQRRFPKAEPRTILGRPALWIVDPLPILHMQWKSASLLVAWSTADSGGTVEVAVVREDPGPGDEPKATLIAERQLPSLPGWPG